MRASGILMPIFSLPSDYGIGTLGEAAKNFVDFLKKAGQSYWQLLPLNQTSFGDSPYQSFSSDAGNPYFIDLDLLSSEGLLKKEEYKDIDFGKEAGLVDYEKLYNERYKVLRIAFSRFDRQNKKYIDFKSKNKEWLYDYALYMSIKYSCGGKGRNDWDDELKRRNSEAVKAAEKQLAEEIEFYEFLQYEFFAQWESLKAYANKNGIKIIGDMPIYVADDSADVWSNPKQFCLDEDFKATVVAGCPPDAFSNEGQLWGNPVYDWEYMEKEVIPFSWWRARIKRALKVYDVLRIDHFRGFESYFCIDASAENAKKGVWKKGPGMKLFELVKNDLGEDAQIIAEDLGILTPEVHKLLENSGFPGMKVLQFAFSSDESDYLPHNHIKNCVVYTGTHDNNTIIGWARSADKRELKYAEQYMNVKSNESINWAMIRTAFASVADTVIIPMPDYLSLGEEGRINSPSTTVGNWQWRMGKGCDNDWLAGIIKEITEIYRR